MLIGTLIEIDSRVRLLAITDGDRNTLCYFVVVSMYCYLYENE